MLFVIIENSLPWSFEIWKSKSNRLKTNLTRCKKSKKISPTIVRIMGLIAYGSMITATAAILID
ncbi:hypothetical protein AAULR_04856 [Lacticaseibacillus rhamnosus MTCC 5462]|nr:hypothetical protein AAULR_04856 [Lacticaseibacillus rhamnosus MTCC 5462]